MIGLVDYDIYSLTSTKLIIPNIEIMKLASYYREENIYCRLLALDSQELEGFEKIYFFSEQETRPIIPDNFLRANNVIYGGTAFTKGKYIPFENSVIDYTIPKPFIYKELLTQKYNDGIKAKVISHVLDDTYYRNYAGENKLPLPAILPRKRVILYDKQFFYPDWQETLDHINNRNPSSIIRVHPVECSTLSEFFAVRSYPKFSRTNDIILNLNIPLEEVPYMLKHYKNQFLADITPSSNVYLTLGGDKKSKLLYYKDIIYKLNLLYSFWSCGIMIKVRYKEPNLGIYDPLQNLSKAIEGWTETQNITRTINDRITKTKKKKPIPTVETEERDMLIKLFPEAKELFNQSFEALKKRRLWRL